MPSESHFYFDSTVELINIKFSHVDFRIKFYSKNCYFQSINVMTARHYLIENCWIGFFSSDCQTASGGVINSCIINNGLFGASQTEIRNCIFLTGPQYNVHYSLVDCRFVNCIFFISATLDKAACLSSGIQFFNCIFKRDQSPPSGIPAYFSPSNYWGIEDELYEMPLVVNNVSGLFNFQNKFKLKANSPYLTAGLDGGQIGIYGGNSPWQDGNRPGNPYIYYKKVDANSSSDGKLKVEYKVRSGN